MHELSLVQSVLDIVDDYAARHGFRHVKTLRLSCGRFSCIDPRSFQFAFDVQAVGTKAEGATLSFDIRPARLTCLTCDQDMEVEVFTATCPRCQGPEVLLTEGTEELKLVDMDVD
jgi:hydrogenase nickel incorporation protein HypA/HybF